MLSIWSFGNQLLDLCVESGLGYTARIATPAMLTVRNVEFILQPNSQNLVSTMEPGSKSVPAKLPSNQCQVTAALFPSKISANYMLMFAFEN